MIPVFNYHYVQLGVLINMSAQQSRWFKQQCFNV